MTISATSAGPAPGLREQKRTATRAALARATLRLAAEHGWSTVTIEQICDEVGVSRRTFFNYFPSREDALLDRDGRGLPEALAEPFVTAGADAPRGPSGLSAGLVDDLVDVMGAMAERLPDRDLFEDLQRAIDKDPRVLVVLRDVGQRSMDDLAALVARREGVPADDPRVQAVSGLVAVLGHRSILDHVEGRTTRSFREVLQGHVDLARALLTG
ncbi:TetR/AcrR family transcriptional regulator [Lapillicoccus jejuensis]|uniref:TetR family transcriptional regulator n=1 Tax=Lapillicoccus jejuensis TaxID=402171 RepID=A0A542DZI7_9MICO|nr:TetR/AcrR family transcriptional regulator [Lapillicoccus jejuensis]TQJ08497.1 TetR family transcriptional regulator [Lapillicoccus jejuensis]